MSRILSIETRNFRGAADAVLHVAPSGMIAAGRNGAGKTSVIRAVRAARGASGEATADAVRTGADEARVIVTTPEYVVTRRILPEGRQPAVKVETTGTIQAAVKRPAEFLAMQAAHSLDPLAFYLAEPKVRREMLLAAMPVAVTEQQLRTWDPSLPAGYSVAGHGLEVLARRYGEVYAARALANRAAEESARKAKEAAAHAEANPVRAVPSVEEAESEVARARATLAALVADTTAAEKAATRSASARARIAEMREMADGQDRLAAEQPQVFDEDVRALDTEVERVDALVIAAEKALAELRAERSRAQTQRDTAEAAMIRRVGMLTHARQLRTQADELEAALDGAAPRAPTADDVAAARADEEAARLLLKDAHDGALRRQLAATADALRTQALADQAQAAALTAAVKALAKDAPAALVAATPGLEGLALNGDTITLGGVSLDGLCGAEQLRFAVDLAKRLGEGAPLRVLTVDGLERVDPEHLDAFVAHCVEGGWQLIATLVERGELTFRQLEEGADDGLFD